MACKEEAAEGPHLVTHTTRRPHFFKHKEAHEGLYSGMCTGVRDMSADSISCVNPQVHSDSPEPGALNLVH
eukprot:356861-Chlamydomonas_euryale.AAC.11